MGLVDASYASATVKCLTVVSFVFASALSWLRGDPLSRTRSFSGTCAVFTEVREPFIAREFALRFFCQALGVHLETMVMLNSYKFYFEAFRRVFSFCSRSNFWVVIYFGA